MRRILLPALLLACIAPVSAQTAYRIGSPPSWVKIHKPNLTAPPVRTEGWEYILTDRQESVGPAGIERYWHAAYRVIDQAAVGDNSQLEIVFDSAYQRLTLHRVTVWRGRRALDQLTRSHIHVAQREPDLEDQIFDGSLTVVVVLEDVRPGDIIEYSYTRAGSNPVFRGHYMAAFQFQYDVPTAEQYVRLLWHRARPVRLHALGTPPQPTIAGEEGGGSANTSGRSATSGRRSSRPVFRIGSFHTEPFRSPTSDRGTRSARGVTRCSPTRHCRRPCGMWWNAFGRDLSRMSDGRCKPCGGCRTRSAIPASRSESTRTNRTAPPWWSNAATETARTRRCC